MDTPTRLAAVRIDVIVLPVLVLRRVGAVDPRPEGATGVALGVRRAPQTAARVDGVLQTDPVIAVQPAGRSGSRS